MQSSEAIRPQSANMKRHPAVYNPRMVGRNGRYVQNSRNASTVERNTVHVADAAWEVGQCAVRALPAGWSPT